MTGPTVPAGCAVLPGGLVADYCAGRLGQRQAWSVEAHVPGCAACRTALAACGDSGRLARNRAVLLARAAMPGPGPVARVLRRSGVPEHIVVLLAATPSLRRSWLAGMLFVLAVAVGAAQLVSVYGTSAAQLAAGHSATTAPLIGGPAGWSGLIPFLFLAPLLPLTAVAAAFSPLLDPACRLAGAAPVSKLWLLCVRGLAVVSATLVPTMLAALALPGPHWLAAALLLPAIAVCAAALALATVIRPAAAVLGVGAGWIALMLGIGMSAGRPESVFGPAGQLIAAAVLIAALALIMAQRNKIDYGWMGQ